VQVGAGDLHQLGQPSMELLDELLCCGLCGLVHRAFPFNRFGSRPSPIARKGNDIVTLVVSARRATA
jgi:hypothetical protein